MAAVPPPAPVNLNLQTFQNAIQAILARAVHMTTQTVSGPIAAVLTQLSTDVTTYVNAVGAPGTHRPLVFPVLVSFKTAVERNNYWGAGAALNQINKLTTELKSMPVGPNLGLRMGVVFSCMSGSHVNIQANAIWHAAVVVWSVPQKTLWVYDPGFPTDFALLSAAQQADLRISNLPRLVNVADFIRQFPSGWTLKISGDVNPN